MIGSLRGQLISKQAPSIVLACNGVGYELDTPMTTFLELPEVGAELFLYTHLVVREDAQILYGFATDDERQMFRTLLKVNRVGAKMALAILSTLSTDVFRRCVETKDTATLSKVPGVGRKTAQRLIVEMHDKIDAVAPSAGAVAPQNGTDGARGEAIDALIALGYKPREVSTLINKLDISGKSAEDIIRSALRQVAQQ